MAEVSGVNPIGQHSGGKDGRIGLSHYSHSKFNNYYKPVGQFMWVNYMPLGLLGIADYLHRNQIKCRVLHQGVEKMNHESWQLEDSLNSSGPPVIALSLHWHYQAYDVIETCKKIRKLFPN